MAQGIFADLLPWGFFVCPDTESVCLTKDGQFLRTVKVVGYDFAFRGVDEIDIAFEQLRNSFRVLNGPGWVIYVDYFNKKSKKVPIFINRKAPVAAQIFEYEKMNAIGETFYHEAYITIGLTIPGAKPKQFRFNDEFKQNSRMTTYLKEFVKVTDNCFSYYSRIYETTSLLRHEEMIRFYHSCFADDGPVLLPEPEYYSMVDFWVSGYLGFHKLVDMGDCLKLDKDYYYVSSIRDIPRSSRHGMLTELLSRNIEFHFATSITLSSKEESRTNIKNVRRGFHQKKQGGGAVVGEITSGEKSPVEDSDMAALADDADEALRSLADPALLHALQTTAIIVHGRNKEELENQIDDLNKLLRDEGYIVQNETNNVLHAFLGALPGNNQFNPRKPTIQSYNFLHFMPFGNVWRGSLENEHLKGFYKETKDIDVTYPHMVTKSGNALFYLNLNNGLVGHTVLFGPTQMGKSTFLHNLTIEWPKYEDARTFFFDKDRSSRWVCKNLNGVFYDIGDESCEFKINPFYALTPENTAYRNWLTGFFIDYFNSKQSTPLTNRQEDLVYSALEALSSHDKEFRSFQLFADNLHDEDLKPTLRPFYEGQFKDMFSVEDDKIAENPMVVFEMNELMNRGKEIVAFVLVYLFYQLEQLFVRDPRPTLLVLDEAWVFLDHPIFVEKIREFLKVLRKFHVYVIFATQEIEDAKTSGIFSTIVNNCFTKIMLPNPGALQSENMELYKQFGLEYNDIWTIAHAEPRRQYFYYSSFTGNRQLFDLSLNKKQLDLIKKYVTVGAEK